MSGLVIRSFSAGDEDAVVALWRRCDLLRSWIGPHDEIKIKVKHDADMLLVGTIDGSIVATAMVGYDGHRGWINYLAVSPDAQRRGIGRAMMTEAERRLLALGCPKVNLQVRATNAAVVRFYSALGYTEDHVISLGKRLRPDAD